MRMGDDTPGLGFAYEDLKAETARLRAELAEQTTWAVVYKTAVEENDRLRAELAALVELSGTWGGRALRAEAKLARVRDLCGQYACTQGTCLACDVFDAIEGEHT